MTYITRIANERIFAKNWPFIFSVNYPNNNFLPVRSVFACLGTYDNNELTIIFSQA